MELIPEFIKCCSGIDPSILRDQSLNHILWALGSFPEPHFLDAAIDPRPWLGLLIFTWNIQHGEYFKILFFYSFCWPFTYQFLYLCQRPLNTTNTQGYETRSSSLFLILSEYIHASILSAAKSHKRNKILFVLYIVRHTQCSLYLENVLGSSYPGF